MRKHKETREIFIDLLRGGLWGKEVCLSAFDDIDFAAIQQLAEEQSVVGLVTAGLEKVQDVKIPQEWALQFIGSTLQIEQRNKEMNGFIEKLMKRLQSTGVFALVVKGQGVAQTYEKPLWRSSGDVDLLLDGDNYEKAKKELFPIAYVIENEKEATKHQAMKIMGIEVELHGRMPFSLSRDAEIVNETVVADALNDGRVNTWKINETDIFVPNPGNHVFLVFTHFLQHFFIEGVGLRQVCDWCRMLWTYRDTLDYGLLELRVKQAGLMTEWKAFASLAVAFLGMPEKAMPFYDSRFKVKGERIMKRVMKSGNFGHNNDLSYRSKYKGMTYKMVATWRRFLDFASLVPVFPADAPRFFVKYLMSKAK